MKIEEWKPVVGYEGLYEVSNFGRVRSVDRYVNASRGRKKLVKSQIIVPIKQNNGYYTVNLNSNGNTVTFSIHRLVAQAFVPNPNNLPCVNHKDECKTNNVSDNLEWCSYEYNNSYGTKPQKISDANSRKVKMFDLEGNYITTFDSCRQALKVLKKKSPSNLSNALSGRAQSAYEHKWEWA